MKHWYYLDYSLSDKESSRFFGSPGTGVTATRCSVCSAGIRMGQSGAWGPAWGDSAAALDAAPASGYPRQGEARRAPLWVDAP